MVKRKTVLIDFTIRLPMEFLEEQTEHDILFYLNEGTFCADSLIDMMEEYARENGCCCEITKAKLGVFPE